jgi:hypothetical protein
MERIKPVFKHPPVYTTESGVCQVLPSDIIRSEAGQQLIREAAALPVGRRVLPTVGTDAGRD